MRQLRRLGADSAPTLPPPCVSCTHWETFPAAPDLADPMANPLATKRDWLVSVTAQGSPAGWIAVEDDAVIGYASAAPARLVPRRVEYAAGQIARDALMLVTVRVVADFRGAGVGSALVRAVAADAHDGGFRAIEAYATTTGSRCLVPAAFLHAVGFETVREHRVHPRLRLDLRGTAVWRDDMARATRRLVAGLRRPLSGPAPVGETRAAAPESQPRITGA